jgi:hypothetical protein
MTKYSFDPSKIVNGPFNTEEEAWGAMKSIANEEHRIDTEENGWRTQIIKNKTCGEITIKNFFASGTDVTEFFLFEIN